MTPGLSGDYMLVVDTLTLILLAKSDLLLLLAKETRTNIPPEVQQEALARKGSYDALMIEEMIRSGKTLVSKPVGTMNRVNEAWFGMLDKTPFLSTAVRAGSPEPK